MRAELFAAAPSERPANGIQTVSLFRDVRTTRKRVTVLRQLDSSSRKRGEILARSIEIEYREREREKERQRERERGGGHLFVSGMNFSRRHERLRKTLEQTPEYVKAQRDI